MKIPEVDFEKKPEPKKKEKDRYPNTVIIVEKDALVVII